MNKYFIISIDTGADWTNKEISLGSISGVHDLQKLCKNTEPFLHI